MSPGANTPDSTSDERLAPLFERHAELVGEWRRIVLTPAGRLRRTFSADCQDRIDEIRTLTATVEREMNQIVKEA